MRKRPYSSFNPYFIVPFIIWIILGGICLLRFDKTTLFAAINAHSLPVLDFIMFYITDLGEAYPIIICLLILLIFVPVFRNWWYFIAALLCNIIPTIIEQWLKHRFEAPRPINYYHNAAWIHVGDHWPILMSNSFPSGHTCGVFAFFCFLSFLLPKKYRWYAMLFFAIALFVGYSRIYLAAHFFEDVYAGSIVGTVTCMAFFALMRKYQYLFFKKEATTNSLH